MGRLIAYVMFFLTAGYNEELRGEIIMQPMSAMPEIQSAASSINGYTDANSSGVSWAAIIAGASADAALAFTLIILGFGLGLSAMSPWANYGASATTIGVSTIIWIAFSQIAASGLGGYLAGRLRIKWANVHSDEVYFRDTAHGFLAWAVACLITVAFLTSTISSVLSGGIQLTATSTSIATAESSSREAANSNPVGYYVDMLFRSPQSGSMGMDSATHQEAVKIFSNNLLTGELSPDDSQYLSKVVSKRTNLSQADAEKRVKDTYSKFSKTIADAETATKETANKLRKAAAYSSLWMFVALLCGAFFASLCATFGGKQRDRIDITKDNRDVV